MLVTLVMLATCFGLLCGIGILFGIVGLLLKFGGKVLGRMRHYSSPDWRDLAWI